jgi:hypothetical protein
MHTRVRCHHAKIQSKRAIEAFRAFERYVDHIIEGRIPPLLAPPPFKAGRQRCSESGIQAPYL